MHMTRWLAAAALSVAAVAGTSARADLFDRSEKAESSDRSSAEGTRFTVADTRDIGKIVTPTSYQPLTAPGADSRLVPVPDPYLAGPSHGPAYYPPTPGGPYPVEGVPVPGYAVEGFSGAPLGPGLPVDGYPLYHRVEYEDLDHIHPCAVPTVVQVLDPCTSQGHHCFFGHHRHRDSCDACQSCGPQCVYVKICVPPGCPKVKVSDRGRKVKYDYGDYKVEIESEDGVVSVDYDD